MSDDIEKWIVEGDILKGALERQLTSCVQMSSYEFIDFGNLAWGFHASRDV